MSAPNVLLRGTLAKCPLPELLVRLLDEQQAGTLVLQEPTGEKSAVLIVRGAPGKARLARSPVFLADVLIDLGIVPRPVCTRAAAEARQTGQHLGQLLLGRKLLTDTSLYVALREQLSRQVLLLCELPGETAFGLYQANYLSDWGASPEWRVKPLPLIWRALVDKSSLERVRQVLEFLGERQLRMRFEAPVARYRMTRAEAAVVNVLRAKPQSAAELRNSGAASDEQVQRTLYALFHTRQLDLGTELAEPVGFREPPESPQSVPPPPRSAVLKGPVVPRRPSPPSSPKVEGLGAVPAGGPASGGTTPQPPAGVPRSKTPVSSPRPQSVRPPEEIAAFRAELAEREKLEKANYYEVLGLQMGVDTAAVRGAFFQLAKRWHPDRLPPELADVREQVTRIFARMSEAHQVLSDPQQRAQYDQGLREGQDPEEQEQVLMVIRAAAAFQRAEVLMKKRDEAGALKEARAAFEGDPTQAEYGALFAWLESRHRKDDVDDLVKILDDAVQKEPDNPRIRWYRGQLYKRLGREAQAMRDFRRIVELVPTHVEAQRELRVYEMRKRSESSSSSSSGLFGRWRKK